MDNKLVLKEKTSNEEFPGIFSDEYLANLNNAGEDIHLHTNENDDDFLTSLNTDLNLNYFPDNMKKNNEGSFMFSNSKILLSCRYDTELDSQTEQFEKGFYD